MSDPDEQGMSRDLELAYALSLCFALTTIAFGITAMVEKFGVESADLYTVIASGLGLAGGIGGILIIRKITRRKQHAV